LFEEKKAYFFSLYTLLLRLCHFGAQKLQECSKKEESKIKCDFQRECSRTEHGSIQKKIKGDNLFFQVANLW
jgi:hypothetical protein